jgi:hypothetical protein
VPKGPPKEILAKLNAAAIDGVERFGRDQAARKSGPADAADGPAFAGGTWRLAEQIAKWWPMIKAADVKADRTLEPDTALPRGHGERSQKH